MESTLIAIGGVAILGFLWKIRGDIPALDRRLIERIGAVDVSLGNRISVLGKRSVSAWPALRVCWKACTETRPDTPSRLPRKSSVRDFKQKNRSPE